MTKKRTVSNSSVAAWHDIIHKKGDTFVRKFRFWQDHNRTVPMFITGTTWKMNVIRSVGKTPLFTFDMTNGFSIVDNNILVLDYSAMLMIVDAGTYLYDIKQTLIDGTKVTKFEGEFVIDNSFTT